MAPGYAQHRLLCRHLSCMRKAIFFLLVLCLGSTIAAAQKIDFAVLGGGQLSFNPNSNLGTGAVIQGNIGARFLSLPLLQVYAAFSSIDEEQPTEIAAGDGRMAAVRSWMNQLATCW